MTSDNELKQWQTLLEALETGDSVKSQAWVQDNRSLIQQQIITHQARRVLGDWPVKVISGDTPPKYIRWSHIEVGEQWEVLPEVWSLFTSRLVWTERGWVRLQKTHIEVATPWLKSDSFGHYFTIRPMFTPIDADTCSMRAIFDFFREDRRIILHQEVSTESLELKRNWSFNVARTWLHRHELLTGPLDRVRKLTSKAMDTLVVIGAPDDDPNSY